jgi:UDP-N-acetylmuramyl pentapeptide phosphotransferase/UDP-N-acetylglucosamine-1-phosphate transferase
MVIAGLKVVFEPGTWWTTQYGFATALSVLCFMFAMNATNFADGLNGLLSGSVLVAVFCAFVDLSMHNTAVASVETISNALVILAGAIFGFFIMNFPRAKIFMGDVGSSFLGVMLGILALQLQYVYKPGYVLPTVHDGPFTLLFPLSFLWFDVIFTILRRALLRRKLSQPHQDHLFHILYRCGFTHTFITTLHIAIALALGLINLLCHMTNIDNEWAAYCYYLIQLIYLIWVFSISKQKGITV